jgi:hypothetical protein
MKIGDLDRKEAAAVWASRGQGARAVLPLFPGYTLGQILESCRNPMAILGFRSANRQSHVERTSCLEARDHRLNKWGFIYLFEMKPGEVPDLDD